MLEHNAAAIRLYDRGGFGQVDELVAWTREPRRANASAASAASELSPSAVDADAIEAIARKPPTCWQREPRGVARAAPFETIAIGTLQDPEAYAFVRPRERTLVLDAGARDAAAAGVLLAALDARVAAQLTLLNEPPRGPLHDALAAHGGWREFARQRRMRTALR